MKGYLHVSGARCGAENLTLAAFKSNEAPSIYSQHLNGAVVLRSAAEAVGPPIPI
jgi:hypothetical protein